MDRVLMLQSPRQLTFMEVEARPLSEGEIRIKSLISGISHGTELSQYRGTSPFHTKRFDLHDRLFKPAPADYSPYPLALGYEMIGHVVEVGPHVEGFVVGDLVHAPIPHSTGAVVNVAAISDTYPVIRLPEGMDPSRGLFATLGAVALLAVQDARVNLGDDVAVFGLGTIGLLAVQLLLRSGARTVIGVDPVEARREVASSLGAHLTIDPRAEITARERIKSKLRGLGVDTAIETSGAYPALHDAIGSVQLGGRVVTVGYYQGPAEGLRLGEEWHHNRPVMVGSMGVWGAVHREHPRWSPRRLSETVVDLLAGGQIATDEMTTKVFPFDRAPEAYAALESGEVEFSKIAFSYDPD